MPDRTSQEFNSLGQILATNGEQSLALAKFYGYSESSISSLYARRFEPLAPEDRESLELLADAIVASGMRQTEQLRAGSLTDVSGPVNPHLFGEETDGRRARYIVEIETEDGEPVIRIYMDYPDLPDPRDLVDDALERGRDIIGRYPERFGLSQEQTDALNTVTIIGTVQRF